MQPSSSIRIKHSRRNRGLLVSFIALFCVFIVFISLFFVPSTRASIGDISSIGSWEYDAQEGRVPDMLRLGTSEYYAIVEAGDAGTDYDGFIRTFKVWDSNGTIQQSVISSYEYDTSDGRYPSICSVSEDLYVISYYDAGATKATVVTVRIWDENGTIYPNVIDSQVLSQSGQETNIINVNNKLYVVAYRETLSSDGWIETVYIDTAGNIVVNDTQEFDTSSAYFPKMIRVDSNTIAIVYSGPGDDGYLSTWNITSAGIITASYASQWEFDTTFCEEPVINFIAGTEYIIAYSDSVTDLWVNTVTIASTGIITKTWIDTLTIGSGYCPYLFDTYTGGMGISFMDSVDSHGFISTFNVTSGGVLDAVIDTYEFDTTGDNWYSIVIHVSGDYYVNVWEGPGNDGWVGTFSIESPPVESQITTTPATYGTYWLDDDDNPLTLTSSATGGSGGIDTVYFYYFYSSDNATWNGIVNYSSDSGSPYTSDFDFNNGTGWYRFYSRAVDAVGNWETAPIVNDTEFGFDNNTISITSPFPANGATGISRSGSPLNANITSSITHTMNVTIWSNVSGAWTAMAWYVGPNVWEQFMVDFNHDGIWNYLDVSHYVASDGMQDSGVYGFLANQSVTDNYGMTSWNSRYWWSVNVTDTINVWKNQTFYFDTETDYSKPTTSVDTISPYWKNFHSFFIDGSASDIGSGINRTELWYRYSADNSSWGAWTLFGTNLTGFYDPLWYFNMATHGGEGYFEFYSRGYDNVSNYEDAPLVADAICAYDTPPVSSVDPIVPYFQNAPSVTLTATATDTFTSVAQVDFYYRYSSDNITFGGWTYHSNDTTSPFSTLFTFSPTKGYFEFYSRAYDSHGNFENAPAGKDALCHAVLNSSVSTVAPTGVQSYNATINGFLNDNGSLDTTCGFLWGESNPPTEHNTTIGIIANGTGFSLNVLYPDICPDTTYYYRAWAHNLLGWVYSSAPFGNFTTPIDDLFYLNTSDGLWESFYDDPNGTLPNGGPAPFVVPNWYSSNGTDTFVDDTRGYNQTSYGNHSIHGWSPGSYLNIDLVNQFNESRYLAFRYYLTAGEMEFTADNETGRGVVDLLLGNGGLVKYHTGAGISSTTWTQDYNIWCQITITDIDYSSHTYNIYYSNHTGLHGPLNVNFRSNPAPFGETPADHIDNVSFIGMETCWVDDFWADPVPFPYLLNPPDASIETTTTNVIAWVVDIDGTYPINVTLNISDFGPALPWSSYYDTDGDGYVNQLIYPTVFNFNQTYAWYFNYTNHNPFNFTGGPNITYTEGGATVFDGEDCYTFKIAPPVVVPTFNLTSPLDGATDVIPFVAPHSYPPLEGVVHGQGLLGINVHFYYWYDNVFGWKYDTDSGSPYYDGETPYTTAWWVWLDQYSTPSYQPRGYSAYNHYWKWKVVLHDVFINASSEYIFDFTTTNILRAHFTYVINGSRVDYTDNSSSYDPANYTITSWLWQFGDGAETDERNPSHWFYGNGNFTTILTVEYTPIHLSDSYSEDVDLYVAPMPESYIDFGGFNWSGFLLPMVFILIIIMLFVILFEGIKKINGRRR